MAMGPQQMQAVQAWINQRLGGACPICKGTSFNFQDQAVLPPIVAGGQAYGIPSVVVPVTCRDCGYVFFLSPSVFTQQGINP